MVLPARFYYYFLFCARNLREAAECAKYVMTKGKLDEQLAGQNLTSYMSLKTLTFKEYKLLDTKLTDL